MASIESIFRRSTLPGLLAFAGAVLLWWQGDQFLGQRHLVDQQIATAKRLLQGQGSGQGRAELEQRRTALRQARTELEQRLTDDGDLELVRARMFYDLRQRCYAVKLNCLIRLSDLDTTASKTQDSGTAAVDPLAKLGVNRVRATISGLLAEQELGDVLAAFTDDEQRVWHFNRVQLKGRAFELDIERHVRVGKGQR